MTVSKKNSSIQHSETNPSSWNEQLEKDSDVLDLLANEALNDISEDDFKDEEW